MHGIGVSNLHVVLGAVVRSYNEQFEFHPRASRRWHLQARANRLLSPRQNKMTLYRVLSLLPKYMYLSDEVFIRGNRLSLQPKWQPQNNMKTVIFFIMSIEVLIKIGFTFRDGRRSSLQELPLVRFSHHI